jgi:long-chain acyl-CoA synthetase
MHKKIEPKPLTLQSLINYSTKNFADKPAVAYVDGIPLTYAELGEKIEEVAALLFSLGLKKEDKVALLSHNMPNWVIAYFSVVANGLIIVPILPDFTRDEINNVMLHSEAKVLFVSERLLSRVDGLDLPYLEAKILIDDLTLLNVKNEIQQNAKVPLIKIPKLTILQLTSKPIMVTHLGWCLSSRPHWNICLG